jgi:ubiquitin carboxyl-terminal hydrolase 7
MDVLDEKQNGAPPMEIDEVVSVRDRKSHASIYAFRQALRFCCHRISLEGAFATKHMPDLGHDVKDFKVFSWRLTNWRKLDKKLTSPEFECGGHKWLCCSDDFYPDP